MYNGYSNFPTWSIVATIDNTQSLYNFFKKLVKRCKETTSDESECKAKLIKHIEDFIVNMKPNKSNIVWDPLINYLLTDEINIREIAESLLDNYD